MTMKLQQIEHLMEVVTAGSIHGAARRLGMSQPALTRSLQQLERDLGVQLLHRGVRGASLTASGTAFLARAKVAHAELDKATEEARRSGDEVNGLVTFGVSPVAGSLLLPELVTSLQQQHPGARARILEMAPSTLLPMIREGGADFAVAQRTRANLDAGLKYTPLFEIQLRVVARKGHPLAGVQELHGLAGAGWIAPTAPGIKDDIITQSFLAIGLAAPTPTLYCGSFFYALETIAASELLLPVPPPLLRTCLDSGRFVEITLTQPLVPLRVGLYARADSAPTTLARAAVRIITGIARRYAATRELRALPTSAARQGRRA